jgi:hypothetical protein
VSEPGGWFSRAVLIDGGGQVIEATYPSGQVRSVR